MSESQPQVDIYITTGTAGDAVPKSSTKIPNSSPAPKQDGDKAAADICLDRMLLDAYEFHGLKELGMYFLYFCFFVTFVWNQWPARGAVFRSSVVESIRSYDTGNNWESSDITQVDNMKNAMEYVTGYLQHYLNYTLELRNEVTQDGTVLIGDYAQVQLAALTVQLTKPECPQTSKRLRTRWKNNNMQNNTLCNFTPSLTNSTRWKPGKEPLMYSTVIVTRSQTDMAQYGLENDTNAYQSRIDQIKQEDMATLATYSSSILLQMLVTSRVDTDVILVELKFEQNHKLWSMGLKPSLLVLTIGTQQDWTQVLLFVLGLLAMRGFTLNRELRIWWLCYCQTGFRWQYFKYMWNWIDLIRFCSSGVFLGWYIANFAVSQSVEQDTDWSKVTITDWDHEQHKAKFHTAFLYLGIGILGCQGFGMVRYMRVHPGLNTFYQVFVLAFETCKDFCVFVLYTFLVLGLLVFGTFQISGGNKLFVDYGMGLAAMARLQFQFLDFEEFTNMGLGFGRRSGFISCLFWASVVLLVVFVANILLAIFQTAHEKVRKCSGTTEHSFPWLAMKRAWFTLCLQPYYYAKFFWEDYGPGSDGQLNNSQPKLLSDWTKVTDRFAARWLDLVLQRHESGPEPSGERQFRTWDLLQARWLIAEHSTVRAMNMLYTNCADLRLMAKNETPTWLDQPMGPEKPKQTKYSQGKRHSLVPCRSERINQHRLLQLMKYIEDHAVNGLPPTQWVRRLLRGPAEFLFLNKLSDEEKITLADKIIRVYRAPVAKRKFRNADDIRCMEEENDPDLVQRKLLDTVVALSSQLQSLSRELQLMKKKTELHPAA